MRRLSELPGMDVYTDQAKMLGKAYDFIIDLQKGEIARITIAPIESLAGMSPQWIKQNTISYHNIVSVGDIIVVSSKPREEPVEEPAPAAKPRYSFVPSRYSK